jgi:hypothetical protein
MRMWRMPQVAEEIWVVEDKTVNKWQGGIEAYKEHLKATHLVRTPPCRQPELFAYPVSTC